MAVVRLKYIRGKEQIKAHLRYITHRRGKTQEKITRLLFDREGLSDKRAAYEMIDSGKRGTAFFKIMISPDPKREDTYKDLDLQHITRQTIKRIEKQLGRHFQFVATVHNDHTPHRHVHGIFLLQGRLSKEEFLALQKTTRLGATQEARLQRNGRDRVRENPLFRSLNRYYAFTQSQSSAHMGKSLNTLRLQAGCQSCGYGQFTGIPIYKIFCPNCSARLKRDRTISSRLEVQL